MADASKLLRALLGKGYKHPSTDIDKLLSDETTDEDGEAQIIQLDQTRIGNLKPKPGTTFQDGYKKAKAEVLTDFEKTLREAYGIESDATGNELIDAIIAAKAKPDAKNISEDDIKKHPAYQNAEKSHKQALKAVQTEWETKLNEREAQYKKGETFGNVSKKALDILAAMNPVIPGNAMVATNIQNAFLSSLKGFEFDIQGDRIVVMKDGKVLEDGHGHSMEFDKLVKDTAGGYYEIKTNNGGANPGGDGGAGAGAGAGNVVYPAGITKPKTFEELSTIVNNTTLKAEDRQIVLQTWEAEQAAGTK
jgi:hypothetical protein